LTSATFPPTRAHSQAPQICTHMHHPRTHARFSVWGRAGVGVGGVGRGGVGRGGGAALVGHEGKGEGSRPRTHMHRPRTPHALVYRRVNWARARRRMGLGVGGLIRCAHALGQQIQTQGPLTAALRRVVGTGSVNAPNGGPRVQGGRRYGHAAHVVDGGAPRAGPGERKGGGTANARPHTSGVGVR
jgi:hypothetical protein